MITSFCKQSSYFLLESAQGSLRIQEASHNAELFRLGLHDYEEEKNFTIIFFLKNLINRRKKSPKL